MRRCHGTEESIGEEGEASEEEGDEGWLASTLAGFRLDILKELVDYKIRMVRQETQAVTKFDNGNSLFY